MSLEYGQRQATACTSSIKPYYEKGGSAEHVKEEAIEAKITIRWLSPQLKAAGVDRLNWANSGSRAAGMGISSSSSV